MKNQAPNEGERYTILTAVMRERNSTDLFMKVALVKVKVKSSTAFRRIVANMTMSCGSYPPAKSRMATSRPME